MRLKVFAQSLCETVRVLLSEQKITIDEWQFIKDDLKDYIQCDNDTYLKAVTFIAKECNVKIKISDDTTDSHIDYNLIGGEDSHAPTTQLALDVNGIYCQILCPIDLDGWRSSRLDEDGK